MGESTVFVVRVWRGARPFRATARAVDCERVATFSSPFQLLRFLASAACWTDTPTCEPPPEAHAVEE